MIEPVQEFIRRTLSDVVVADIETAGLDRFRHPAISGGIVQFKHGEAVSRKEFRLGVTRGGKDYLPLPSVVPANTAERKILERLLNRRRMEGKTRYMPIEHLEEIAEPWVKKHVLPHVAEIKAGVTHPIDFTKIFFEQAKGNIFLLQNERFEAQRLNWLMRPKDYENLARTAFEANAEWFGSLKMIPKETRLLLSEANKANTAGAWWQAYRGEGGLSWALEERARTGKTLGLDLSDVTKSMLGGLKKHGLYSGADIHTGASINILQLAWHGQAKAGEAHRAVADAEIEGDILRRHVTIAEKVKHAEDLKMDPAKLFNAKEDRYLQRLSNVNTTYKLHHTEKTLASYRKAILSGEGASLVTDTISIKAPMWQQGRLVEDVLLKNLPLSMSSKELAEVSGAKSVEMAHKLQERAVFERYVSYQPQEIVPDIRRIWDKVRQMRMDELVTTAEMEMTNEELVSSMAGTGSIRREWPAFKKDMAAAWEGVAERFKKVYSRTPSWMKYGAVAAVGLAAAGAVLHSPDRDIQRTQRTTSHPYSTIEGIRREDSVYNKVRGIHASYLPHANVSDFGSGYDHIRGALRGAYRMYVNAKGTMSRFAIAFERPPKKKPRGLAKDRGAMKYRRVPTPDVPVLPPGPGNKGYMRGLEQLKQPVRNQGRRYTPRVSKQALDFPDLTAVDAARVAMTRKAVDTKYKLFVRQTPARAAYSPYRGRDGYSHLMKLGMTDMGSPTRKGCPVSKHWAKKLTRPKSERVLQMKDFSKTTEAAQTMDKDPHMKQVIFNRYSEQVVKTAGVRMPTGVKQRTQSLSPGKIFNMMDEFGPAAGNPEISKGSSFYSSKKKPKLYEDLLTSVGSEYSAVKQGKFGDKQWADFYRGKAGQVTKMQTKRHNIGSQHLRTAHLFRSIDATVPTRGRHPVRSRALRAS